MGNYQMITAMRDHRQMLIEHFLSFFPFFVHPCPLTCFWRLQHVLDASEKKQMYRNSLTWYGTWVVLILRFFTHLLLFVCSFNGRIPHSLSSNGLVILPCNIMFKCLCKKLFISQGQFTLYFSCILKSQLPSVAVLWYSATLISLVFLLNFYEYNCCCGGKILALKQVVNYSFFLTRV